MSRPLALVALLLAFATIAAADKVILKNGEVIRGKVLGEEGDRVVIKLESGKVRIQKDRIDHVEYDKPPVEPPEGVVLPPVEETPPTASETPATDTPPTPGTAPASAAVPPATPPGSTALPGTAPSTPVPGADQVIIPPEAVTPLEKQKIEELLKNLNSADGIASSNAVTALAGMGGKALNAISTVLARSTEKDAVKHALEVASNSKDARLLPALRLRAHDPDTEIRQTVCMALPGFAEGGLDILRELAADPEESVRVEVCSNVSYSPKCGTALGILLRLVVDGSEKIRAGATNTLLSWDGENLRSGRMQILTLLAHADAGLRFWGIRLAGKATLDEAMPKMLEIAKNDSEPINRREALIALGGMSTQNNPGLEAEYFDMIRAAVASEDEQTRFLAYGAIVQKKGESWVVDALIQAMGDASPRIRSITYEGLKKITGQSFLEEQSTWSAWWEGQQQQER